ncbi:unnamed protein product, partial [Didymodactylos carnosus]
RDDTVRFNGLSITDCNNYVKRRLSRRYPNIYKLSNSTIRRLFMPPKKNVRSQKFYKSIIPAKIPQKQNSKCQHHPDFHITCAQVNYVQELASLYNDECISLSCDNKAKIPLGIPVVSRHVRSRKFLLLNQSPNLPDHDFPKAGVKITPAGYVRLWHHRRSSSANSNPTPASLLRMKRSKSCESTLFKLNREIKQTVDKRNLKHVQWNRSGQMFLRPFGSTSEKLQVNRYNPIERMFSHLTDLIANVTIDLDPTFSTINHQLDSALVDLNKYWHNKKYDNFKTDCRPVFSVNENSFDGHQELKDKLMKSSVKHVMDQDNDNVRFNLRLYLRHCVRSSYYVSFTKCTDSTCIHCTRHPVRATKTVKLLRSGGDYLPWPQMTFSKYHYDTFLQQTYAILAGEKNIVPDQQLPSDRTKRCSECKLPYIFSSKADEERHMVWVHWSNVLPNKKRKHSPTPKSKSVSKSKQRITRKRELSPEY